MRFEKTRFNSYSEGTKSDLNCTGAAFERFLKVNIHSFERAAFERFLEVNIHSFEE